MHRVSVTIFAATVFVVGGPIMQTTVDAAPIVAPAVIRSAADSLNVIERVQFIWLGRNYCWYDDGWNGPGWYWCGQYLTSGIGWGGGYGWHGWHGGHRSAAVVHGGHVHAPVVRNSHAHTAVVRSSHTHAPAARSSHPGAGGHSARAIGGGHPGGGAGRPGGGGGHLGGGGSHAGGGGGGKHR